ncbi:DUF3034 family protein [Methylophaga lonarensis]|uniref:DUF3034 family protein n=1 Tax=Methylophaga lonarensis TaxID=999151 RepID=UPI003D27457D
MRILIIFSLMWAGSIAHAADGKLIATPGVSQIEGSAGGGIVPWAQLAGYASRDEIAGNVFCSRGDVSDYRLDVCGAQANFYDRVEFSVAKQRFRINAADLTIRQDVFGIKTRVYGDLVYSRFPQVSLGVMHKRLRDDEIANALGAKRSHGTDFYVAASKLHLGAFAGYNWLWNLTARHTSANELGILGHGGPDQGRRLQLEASTAVLLGRHVAVGVEYRQKPDNLGLGEDDWKDIFVAWIPNKHLNVTAAWLDLGDIAGAKNQRGWYLSVTGNF